MSMRKNLLTLPLLILFLQINLSYLQPIPIESFIKVLPYEGKSITLSPSISNKTTEESYLLYENDLSTKGDFIIQFSYSIPKNIQIYIYKSYSKIEYDNTTSSYINYDYTFTDLNLTLSIKDDETFHGSYYIIFKLLSNETSSSMSFSLFDEYAPCQIVTDDSFNINIVYTHRIRVFKVKANSNQKLELNFQTENLSEPLTNRLELYDNKGLLFKTQTLNSHKYFNINASESIEYIIKIYFDGFETYTTIYGKNLFIRELDSQESYINKLNEGEIKTFNLYFGKQFFSIYADITDFNNCEESVLSYKSNRPNSEMNYYCKYINLSINENIDDYVSNFNNINKNDTCHIDYLSLYKTEFFVNKNTSCDPGYRQYYVFYIRDYIGEMGEIYERDYYLNFHFTHLKYQKIENDFFSFSTKMTEFIRLGVPNNKEFIIYRSNYDNIEIYKGNFILKNGSVNPDKFESLYISNMTKKNDEGFTNITIRFILSINNTYQEIIKIEKTNLSNIFEIDKFEKRLTFEFNTDKSNYELTMVNQYNTINTFTHVFIEQVSGSFIVNYKDNIQLNNQKQGIFIENDTNLLKENDYYAMNQYFNTYKILCRIPGILNIHFVKQRYLWLEFGRKLFLIIPQNNEVLISFPNIDKDTYAEITIGSPFKDIVFNYSLIINTEESKHTYNGTLVSLSKRLKYGDLNFIKFNADKECFVYTLFSRKNEFYAIQENEESLNVANAYKILDKNDDYYKVEITLSGFNESFYYQIGRKDTDNDFSVPLVGLNGGSFYNKSIGDSEFVYSVFNPYERINKSVSEISNYYYFGVSFENTSLSDYNVKFEYKKKQSFSLLVQNKVGIVSKNKKRNRLNKEKIVVDSTIQIEKEFNPDKKIVIMSKKCFPETKISLISKYYDYQISNTPLTKINNLVYIDNLFYDAQLTSSTDTNKNEDDIEIFYSFINKKDELDTKIIDKYNTKEEQLIISYDTKEKKLTWSEVNESEYYEIYILNKNKDTLNNFNNDCYLLKKKDNLGKSEKIEKSEDNYLPYTNDSPYDHVIVIVAVFNNPIYFRVNYDNNVVIKSEGGKWSTLILIGEIAGILVIIVLIIIIIRCLTKNKCADKAIGRNVDEMNTFDLKINDESKDQLNNP